MYRIVVISIAVLGVALVAVHAQGVQPDSDRSRFTFKEVTDGLLRLDKGSGQVSLCGKRAGAWACEAVADDRTALETEIARLQAENAKLRREFLAHGLTLPDGLRSDARPGKPDTGDLNLPSDADLDRVMAFLDRLWRRLLDMVQNLQKENGQKETAKQKDADRKEMNGKGIDAGTLPERRS